MSRFASYSEWAAYKDCPARWHADYVLRRPRGSSHPSRRLGSLFEACFAAKLRAWALTFPGVALAPQQYQAWRAHRGMEFVRVVDEPVPHDAKERFPELERGQVLGPPETFPCAALLRKCAEEQWPNLADYPSTEEAGETALALADRAFELIGFSGGRFRPAVVRGVAAVQLRLECPLPPDPDPSRPGGRTGGYYVGLRGVPDLVVLDGERDWRPVLGDTKVRGASLGEVDLGCDPQLAIYQHLLAQNGLRVVECEQWGVLGKLPTEPPLTKSTKKVSRDAEHPTTPELYEAACRRNGEKPDAGHLEKLAARRWSQATPGGGTDAEVARTIAELCADLEVMAALATRPDAEWLGGVAPITRNNRTWAGSPCNRCDVRSECHETKSRGLPLSAAFCEPQVPREVQTLDALEQEVME